MARLLLAKSKKTSDLHACEMMYVCHTAADNSLSLLKNFISRPRATEGSFSLFCFKRVVCGSWQWYGTVSENMREAEGEQRDWESMHKNSPILVVFHRRRHIILIICPNAVQRRCRCFHLYYHYFSVQRHLSWGPQCNVLPAKPERGTTSRKASQATSAGAAARQTPHRQCALFSVQVRPHLLKSSAHPPLSFPSFFFPPSPRLQEEPSFTGTVDLAQVLAYPAKWVLLTAADSSWLRRWNTVVHYWSCLWSNLGAQEYLSFFCHVSVHMQKFYTKEIYFVYLLFHFLMGTATD